jgi:hypothetical protein
MRRLPVLVQPSSERTLDPVRRDNSFAEKQESHSARLLIVDASMRELAGETLA